MNKTVLITGGSSGIGYALARVFAENSYNLVLAAKTKEPLVKAAEDLKSFGTKVEIVVIDLAKPESPTQLYSELHKRQISIDVLINNAGFASYGSFIENDLDWELNEMQVNMVTLTHLTKLFARDMVKRKHGKILNVASTAAFLPGPLMAVYYASKAYVLSFSEALAEELRDTGVSVSALCPGPTNTGFVKRAQLQQSKLFQGDIMQADDVAKAAFKGLMENQTVIIPGIKNQFIVGAIKFVPRKFVPKVVKQMQAKEDK
jgi:hypothetical protein